MLFPVTSDDSVPALPLAALGPLNARRFRILQVLAQSARQMTVSELARQLGSQSLASLHRDLAALEGVGLVRGTPEPERRQQGLRVHYEASRDDAAAMFLALAESL